MKKSLILVGIVSSFLVSSLIYASPFNDSVSVDESGNGSLGYSTQVDNSKEIKNRSENSRIQNSKNETRRILSGKELEQREIIYRIRGGTYRVW